MTDLLNEVYLMSPPRTDWALRGKANFKSRAADAVDARKARAEWATLATAIVEAGGEVLVMPPHPDRPLTGMIYTAEAGELYHTSDGTPRFVLPNMATAHRREEVEHIDRFVREELGIETERIEATWEAQGDAIRGAGAGDIVHTYGAGPDARTSREAYAEVAERLSPRHIQIEFVADPWFHGNTFLQVFRAPPGASTGGGARTVVLVCPDALAGGAQGREFERLQAFLPDARFVTITPEESQGYDTNSLQVGQTVLAPRSLSSTAREAAESLGLRVRTLDLSELFLKGGGAPVCLTNRLWGLRADDLPDTFRWSKNPTLEL